MAFTFEKWNRNETKGFQLGTPVSTDIESKHLIFFNSGVPTLVAKDTAATNDIYILAEDLVKATTKQNVPGQRDTAVVYDIRDTDLLVAEYEYPTATSADAPSQGDDVAVDAGARVVKPGEGEVARFKIVEVSDVSFTEEDNTIVRVVVKKI